MAKKRNNKTVSEQMAPDDIIVEDTVSVAEPEPVKVDFDAWYASRGAIIPRQHYKEILKADFKARGLSTIETMEMFDEALRKYGVKF